jgi:hypothetical protein
MFRQGCIAKLMLPEKQEAFVGSMNAAADRPPTIPILPVSTAGEL